MIYSLEKYLLALKCLKAALTLDKDHPRVLEQVSQFRSSIDSVLPSLPPQVQEIIKSEFTP